MGTLDEMVAVMERAFTGRSPNPRLAGELLVAVAVGLDLVSVKRNGERSLSHRETELLRRWVWAFEGGKTVSAIAGRGRPEGGVVKVNSRFLTLTARRRVMLDLATDLPSESTVHDATADQWDLALAIKIVREDVCARGSVPSEEAAKIERERAATMNLDVQFTVGTGSIPPSDLVIANFENIGTGLAAIAEMQRFARRVPIETVVAVQYDASQKKAVDELIHRPTTLPCLGPVRIALGPLKHR